MANSKQAFAGSGISLNNTNEIEPMLMMKERNVNLMVNQT